MIELINLSFLQVNSAESETCYIIELYKLLFLQVNAIYIK